MSVAWSAPLSQNPPLLGIAVAKKHFSSKLIRDSGEFVLNIPSKELIKAVKLCGSVSGKDADKFKESGLTPVKGKKVKAPLIKECLASIECTLKDAVDAGDHFFFIGEVVHAEASDKYFSEEFIVDLNNVQPLSHLGGSSFGILKEVKQ